MKEENAYKYMEDYLKDCSLRKRLSQKTIRAYKIDLRQYFEFVGEKKDDLKIINDYIHFLNKKYSKYKTVKRKIASIKAFYSYLEYEEIITFSPFNKIRTKIKEPKMLPKIIQKEDLNRIFTLLFNNLSNANTEYKKKLALRNITIIELLFSTGIRISELCNIHTNDISFKDRSLKIFGKGSKERILYLGSDQVIDFLKKYIDSNAVTAPENNYIFFFQVSVINCVAAAHHRLILVCEKLSFLSHIIHPFFIYHFNYSTYFRISKEFFALDYW